MDGAVRSSGQLTWPASGGPDLGTGGRQTSCGASDHHVDRRANGLRTLQFHLGNKLFPPDARDRKTLRHICTGLKTDTRLAWEQSALWSVFSLRRSPEDSISARDDGAFSAYLRPT